MLQGGKHMKKTASLLLIAVLIFSGIGTNILFSKASADLSKNLVVSVSFSEGYQIINTSNGQKIQMEGFNYLFSPGKPLLPAKTFLIALPPNARVESVTVKGLNATQLSGVYHITPTPPIIPLGDFDLQKYTSLQKEWRENKKDAYLSDQPYPNMVGRFLGVGTLRKYFYVSVSLCPFRYHPKSGRLIHYNAAQIIINYSLSKNFQSHGIKELKMDTLADEKASELFVNYQQIKNLYHSRLNRNTETYDYVILTTSDLFDAINSSNFLGWKKSLGYNVKIVFISDELIISQPGVDLAERIRNFLRSYYITWGIKYVLLVGDYKTIPMRYCSPDPEAGEIPTDYYYADLSFPDADSWDLDDYGVYGEYGEDAPDFLADVYVGRIPTDDPVRITYALNKLVSFEKDSGEWKHHALNVGAFFYFTDEISGHPAIDGATCMDVIEKEVMENWTISHYSEQEGLETSVYKWRPLNEENFTSDWRNNRYSVVNWAAHGWTNRAARKVWSKDDGDDIPETNEISWYNFISTSSSLDDDYPSIVFAISCKVGSPEPYPAGRLGVDLLTKPSFGSSAGIISSTRTPYGSSNWPSTPGGAESICLEFNRYMIQRNERVGEALYDSKYTCNLNYSLNHYAEYCNMFTFNLYGDPSMILEGVASTVPDVDIVKPGNAIYFNNNKIMDFSVPIIIGPIDVTVNVSDNLYDIDRVEFYIDDELRYIDNNGPYSWRWDEQVFLKHGIKVIVYNNVGNYAIDKIMVWKFF